MSEIEMRPPAVRMGFLAHFRDRPPKLPCLPPGPRIHLAGNDGLSALANGDVLMDYTHPLLPPERIF